MRKVMVHPTVILGRNVSIGKGVTIGAHSIIYDNVAVGGHSVLGPYVILGEPRADSYRKIRHAPARTVIGAHALIRSGTVIYEGCTIGSHFHTGHHAVIREGTVMGSHCSFGTFAQSDGNCAIGNYSRIHYCAHVCQKAVVGNFVWLYPYSILVNDLHPPCNRCTKGAVISDYAVVGTHSVISPGVKLGAHSLVGANSVVTKDVAAKTFVFGNPARKISFVNDIKCRRTRSITPYPWPSHFSKGYPWERSQSKEKN